MGACPARGPRGGDGGLLAWGGHARGGGVDTCPGGPEDTPEALLKRADEGVYEAKASGRNTVVGKAA